MSLIDQASLEFLASRGISEEHAAEMRRSISHRPVREVSDEHKADQERLFAWLKDEVPPIEGEAHEEWVERALVFLDSIKDES